MDGARCGAFAREEAEGAADVHDLRGAGGAGFGGEAVLDGAARAKLVFQRGGAAQGTRETR